MDVKKTSQEEDMKELQQKYMTFQLLEKQLKQVHAQAQQLEQQIEEVGSVIVTLKQLGDVPKDTEMLIPVSSGVFFQGKIVDAKDVFVNVGAGAVVKKSAQDTEKILQEQMSELRRLQEDRMTRLQELSAYTQRLQEELAKAVGQE